MHVYEDDTSSSSPTQAKDRTSFPVSTAGEYSGPSSKVDFLAAFVMLELCIISYRFSVCQNKHKKFPLGEGSKRAAFCPNEN